jgi:NADPH:quinone reductase-like Zn-dependent oxidoreductase
MIHKKLQMYSNACLAKMNPEYFDTHQSIQLRQSHVRLGVDHHRILEILMKRFEGKTVVITGGNSGIGLAAAKLFREEGANVAISGRDQKTLDSAAQTIGGNTLTVKADVSNLAEIDKFYAR